MSTTKENTTEATPSSVNNSTANRGVPVTAFRLPAMKYNHPAARNSVTPVSPGRAPLLLARSPARREPWRG